MEACFAAGFHGVENPRTARDYGLVVAHPHGYAGVIGIDHIGEFSRQFNQERMAVRGRT